jgi:hypothetical protein
VVNPAGKRLLIFELGWKKEFGKFLLWLGGRGLNTHEHFILRWSAEVDELF